MKTLILGAALAASMLATTGAQAKTFEEYCLDENLPADQRDLVVAVLNTIVSKDCAEPQRYVDEFGGLTLRGKKRLTTIKPLDGLTGLKVLSIGQNMITDLSPLTKHTSLEALGLSSNGISDISVLAHLTNLRTLYLDNNRVTDISPLKALTKLEDLAIRNNPVTDFSALASLPQLEILEIGRFATDVDERCVFPSTHTTGLKESLPHLKNLTKFAANSLDIEDTTAIEAMAELRELQLDCNLLTETNVLNTLPKLQVLSLSFNTIKSLSVDKPHDKLYWLVMLGNGITSIDFLNNLTNITTLNLKYNEILDASPLAKLSGLSQLDFGNNRVQDASFVSDLAALWYLDLADNDLATFPFAKATPELAVAFLSGNSLTSIEGVQQLPKLRTLTLATNPLADITPLSKIAEHQKFNLDISNTDVTDLSPLRHKFLSDLLLDNGNFSSMDQIPPLRSLDTFSMKNGRLTSIDGLRDRFGGLYGIRVSHNPITDLKELRNFSSFGVLELAGIQAGGLEPLKELSLINYADLSDMGATSLVPLAKVEGLRKLLLNDNSIADLSPLHDNKNHRYLNHLELNNNKVSSLAPLANKTDLIAPSVLKLKGNPLGTSQKKTEQNCPTNSWSKAVNAWCSKGETYRSMRPFVSSTADAKELFRQSDTWRVEQLGMAPARRAKVLGAEAAFINTP